MENEKNNLFVNGLSYSIDSDELETIFAGVEGVKILEAKVIMEKDDLTRSRGFGFVKLENEKMAQDCISQLNGKEFSGRQIFVNVAKPREDRGSNRGSYAGGARRSYR